MEKPIRDKEEIPDCPEEYFPIPLRTDITIKEAKHFLVWPDCNDGTDTLPIIDKTEDEENNGCNDKDLVLGALNIDDEELEQGIFFFQALTTQ